MYPDDPRMDPARRRRRTVREQVMLVLMAIGIAVVVTAFAGVLLYLGEVFGR